MATTAARRAVQVEELKEAGDTRAPASVRREQGSEAPAASAGALIARPGDTIQEIARREGLSALRLAILNSTTPHARLFPGQPIRILRDSPRPRSFLRFGAVRVVQVPTSVTQGLAGWLQVAVSRPLPLEVYWNNAQLGVRPLAIRAGAVKDGAERGVETIWGCYVPAPASMEAGVYHLTLRYETRDGVAVTRSYPVHVLEGEFASEDIRLPAGKSVLLEEELLLSEQDKLSPIWSQTNTNVQWRQALTLPLPDDLPLTSRYGNRRSYNGGQYYAFHTGQDFAAPGGTPVIAPADAVVALAEPLDVRGISVILDHGAGLFTGYWHLQETLVAPGSSVRAGDLIGLVGTTGRSTGAHLHWELRIYGFAVDPLPFLEQPLLSLAESGEEPQPRSPGTDE